MYLTANKRVLETAPCTLHLFFILFVCFDPYDTHMNLYDELCSSGWPANSLAVHLARQKLSIGHYMQTFPPNLFLPNYDFCYFIPFSLTLAFDGSRSG